VYYYYPTVVAWTPLETVKPLTRGWFGSNIKSSHSEVVKVLFLPCGLKQIGHRKYESYYNFGKLCRQNDYLVAS